jgi:FAD/FMN-containing dehydrogenase
MTRFNEIVINEKEGTVEFGTGLTWTDVYSYLVPRGLNVVGGRLNGVGVGGFTLGGGRCYSAFRARRTSLKLTVLTSLLHGRIFLEDQPVRPYRGHPYGN